MGSALLKLLVGLIPSLLDWIVGKLAPVFRSGNRDSASKQRQDARIAQAKKIEEIRQQLLKARSQNLAAEEVKSLEDQLREATDAFNDIPTGP